MQKLLGLLGAGIIVYVLAQFMLTYIEFVVHEGESAALMLKMVKLGAAGFGGIAAYRTFVNVNCQPAPHAVNEGEYYSEAP